MKVGVIHFAVSDIEQSLEFYEGKLGLKLEKLMLNLDNLWAELDGGGVVLGIQEIKEKFEEDQPPWRGAMISFEVKNIEKTKVELENKGVRFTTDIIELEGVKIAKCEDPDGNPLEIHERT